MQIAVAFLASRTWKNNMLVTTALAIENSELVILATQVKSTSLAWDLLFLL